MKNEAITKRWESELGCDDALTDYMDRLLDVQGGIELETTGRQVNDRCLVDCRLHIGIGQHTGRLQKRLLLVWYDIEKINSGMRWESNTHDGCCEQPFL